MTEYQSLFHKKLLAGNFVYTAETTPPDSSDQEILLKKTKPLKGIEFIFAAKESSNNNSSWIKLED